MLSILRGLEIPLRIYFTKQSFILVRIKVKHGQEHQEGDRSFMRYGCVFDKSLTSFAVLNNFIEFLYSFAEHSSIDRNDAKVFFL